MLPRILLKFEPKLKTTTNLNIHVAGRIASAIFSARTCCSRVQGGGGHTFLIQLVWHHSECFKILSWSYYVSYHLCRRSLKFDFDRWQGYVIRDHSHKGHDHDQSLPNSTTPSITRGGWYLLLLHSYSSYQNHLPCPTSLLPATLPSLVRTTKNYKELHPTHQNSGGSRRNCTVGW